MSSPSFWAKLATYCSELAPVTGPLLDAVGNTAVAIERANNQAAAFPARSRTVQRAMRSPEDE